MIERVRFFVLPALLGAAALASVPGPALAQSAATADDRPSAPDSTLDARIGAVVGRPGGLTADQVARRAAATSYDAQARHYEVAAAAASVDQAWFGYVPRLALTARYTRLSPITPPVFGNLVAAPGAGPGPLSQGAELVNVPFSIPVVLDNTLFQASLTVPLSDYLLRASQAHAAATHSRRAAELTERAARLRAAFDARVTYYNWVRARLQTVVTEQALAQARDHLTDVRHGFDVGAVSQADVMRVQSQAASAELLAARAANLAALLEDQVRTATRAPAGGPLAIGEDVRGDAPPVPDAADAEALYAEAVSRRPELRALVETADAARDTARVARAGAYPRVDAIGDVITANPNPRIFPQQNAFTTTWDVGVALTWAPTDIGPSLAAARGADARASAALAQRGAARDQLRAEVLGAFTAVREAEVALRTTASGLAAAEESYRVRRVLFRNGRATSVELTDAETDLTRARLEALNARVDQRVAQARLLHATGRDVASLDAASLDAASLDAASHE